MNLKSVRYWTMPLALMVILSCLVACSSESTVPESENNEVKSLLNDITKPASGEVNDLLQQSQKQVAQGNLAEAKRLLDKAQTSLGRDKQYLVILPVRGNLEFAMNQPDLAYRDFDQCLKMMKVNAENINTFKNYPVLRDMIKICYFGRMLCASKRGDAKQAIEDAKLFKEIKDGDKTGADIFLAVFYIFDSNFDQAQKQFDLINKTPNGKRVTADYEKTLKQLKSSSNKTGVENAITEMREKFWLSNVEQLRVTTVNHYQKLQ